MSAHLVDHDIVSHSAVPGVIYALLMNLCALAFIIVMRLKTPSLAGAH